MNLKGEIMVGIERPNDKKRVKVFGVQVNCQEVRDTQNY